MAKNKPPEKPKRSSSSSSKEPDHSIDYVDFGDDDTADAGAGDRHTPLERHGAGASSSAELDQADAKTEVMQYPAGCQCTKDPCPCYCHTVPDSVRAIAFQRRHTPRAPEQILRVRHAGQVVHVPVCWSAEQVDAAHAKHRDGIVDLLRVRQPGYQSLGTPAELDWLHKRAAELAKK